MESFDEIARRVCFCCCDEVCMHTKGNQPPCISCKAIASALQEREKEIREDYRELIIPEVERAYEINMAKLQATIDDQEKSCVRAEGLILEAQKQIAEKDATIARLKTEKQKAEKDLAEADALLDWIQEALTAAHPDIDVSDFGQSFPIIRKVVDFACDKIRLEMEASELEDELAEAKRLLGNCSEESMQDSGPSLFCGNPRPCPLHDKEKGE